MLKQFVFCSVVFVSSWLACNPVQAQQILLAREAVEILNDELGKRAACHAGTTKTVGIWPIDSGNLPISATNAERFYESFLAMLISGKPDCVTVLDGKGVGDVLRYSNAVRAFRDQGTGFRRAIEQNMQAADFIISIQIREQNGHVDAMFKLTDRVSGGTLATAPPIRVPPDYLGNACGDGSVLIASAVKSAAQSLIDSAPEMRTLIVGGGFFGGSDARTGLSEYLTDLLVDQIVQTYNNPTTKKRLQVIDPSQNDQRQVMFKTRGAHVEARNFTQSIDLFQDQKSGSENVTKPKSEDRKSGSPEGQASRKVAIYKLTSRYWLCPNENRAKIKVQLASGIGEVVSWSGSLRLEDLPAGLGSKPPQVVKSAAFGPAGAFVFGMTSARGLNPIYRAGERMLFNFALERDAWLYCFYSNAGGETYQFLPNAHQPGDSRPGRRGENFFAANTAFLFPTKFNIRVDNKTIGIETFTCFAASRNITGDLPEMLRGLPPKKDDGIPALPNDVAERLPQIFAALPGVAISVQTVTLTVME